MSSLGQNFARVDGPAKLRGWAQFTADIEMPGMVYAKVLRSTHPHARLLRVDASKAAKLPGVVAVLTRDDLKGMNSHFGPVVKDQPVVAIDRVQIRRRHHRGGGGGGERSCRRSAGVDRGGIRAVAGGLRSALKR